MYTSTFAQPLQRLHPSMFTRPQANENITQAAKEEELQDENVEDDDLEDQDWEDEDEEELDDEELDEDAA
jgi:hypothetical protein